MLSYSAVFIKKDKFTNPPTLTIAWEIYKFFKIAILNAALHGVRFFSERQSKNSF